MTCDLCEGQGGYMEEYSSYECCGQAWKVCERCGGSGNIEPLSCKPRSQPPTEELNADLLALVKDVAGYHYCLPQCLIDKAKALVAKSYEF